jgi:hypothetical protein
VAAIEQLPCVTSLHLAISAKDLHGQRYVRGVGGGGGLMGHASSAGAGSSQLRVGRCSHTECAAAVACVRIVPGRRPPG